MHRLWNSGVCGEESDAWKVGSTCPKRQGTKDKDPCDASHMGVLDGLSGKFGALAHCVTSEYSPF